MLGPVLVFVGLAPMLARNLPRAGREHGDRRRSCSSGRSPRSRSRSRSTCNVDVCVFVVQGLVLVGAAVVLTAQHQQRDRSRHRADREAIAVGAPRPRLSAGAAVPHVDDARHVRARRVHPRARLGVRVDVLRPDRPVHARRVGRVQRRRRSRTRATRSRSTRLAREPGVRAVAPLAHRERADHGGARARREPREWAATGFDARFVDHGAPKLDDDGGYAERRRRVPRGARVARPRDRRGARSSRRAAARRTARSSIGDQFTVQDEASGRSRTFTVAAISDARRREQRRARSACTAAHDLFGARAVAEPRVSRRARSEGVRGRVRRALPRQRRQGARRCAASCRTTWRSNNSSSC